MKARRLEPRFVERVWGRRDLAPLYPPASDKIGEVWFQPSADFPLLVKFLFTSEPLSVQVHPGDDYAREHENSRGKCEMWHILAAEPGAKIAIGFRSPVTREQLRRAVEDGSVSDLLQWIEAAPGDTFYTHTGVVHAIGAGITLCEIQQNSEVTYRLFDYGRGREVHVEKALAVVETGAYDARRPFPVSCDYFHTESLDLESAYRSPAGAEELLIFLDGRATLEGQRAAAGEVWFVPDGGAEVVPDGGPARLLRALCR